MTKQTDTMNAQQKENQWHRDGRGILDGSHNPVPIAVFGNEDNAQLAVDRHNNYARVLALNRELREACEYVMQNLFSSLTSGTKEKLRAVLAKAAKESQ